MNPRKVLHPKSVRKRPAATFDENARKEYLTGFQKRKKQRKRKAHLYQLKQVKNARKKLRNEKKESVKKKLNAYGLEEDAPQDDSTSTAQVTTEQCSRDDSASNSCTYEEHPNHLVIINTDPDFGNSLSALVNEDT